MSSTWHKRAVFYEVYVRSFQDSDNDGIGDIPGVSKRLNYLNDLGIDAVWLTPFFKSPMLDHGYDIADYRVVDPLFGTMENLNHLIRELKENDIRILFDLVPNHTSDAHEWFQEALANPDRPGPRDRYIFSQGSSDGNPPNNWVSVFGGSAWTKYDDEYYLHLFAESQPDLNWRNKEVVSEFEEILAYWLKRGVDGFRIDVAHGMFKDLDLRDEPHVATRVAGTDYQGLDQVRVFDLEEVHDIHKSFRTIVAKYENNPILLGEVYLHDTKRAARYGAPDKLNLVLAFGLTTCLWNVDQVFDLILDTHSSYASEGATPAWVLDSHDVSRSATRFGGGTDGRQKSLAMTMMQLALPGACVIYQGQELALEDGQLNSEERTDPIYAMSEGKLLGRDGCRVPMPWEGHVNGFGFTDGVPWLPQRFPDSTVDVATQLENESSPLSIFRKALNFKNNNPVLNSGEFVGVKKLNGFLILEWKYESLFFTSATNMSGTTNLSTNGTPVLSSLGRTIIQIDGAVEVLSAETVWIVT